MIWENSSIKETNNPEELKEALTIKDLGEVSPKEEANSRLCLFKTDSSRCDKNLWLAKRKAKDWFRAAKEIREFVEEGIKDME